MQRWFVWVLVIALLLPGAARAQAPTLTVYSSVDEENARKLLGAFSRWMNSGSYRHPASRAA